MEEEIRKFSAQFKAAIEKTEKQEIVSQIIKNLKLKNIEKNRKKNFA